MATLVSITSGNFTSASTWGVVDNTSFLDSRVGSATLASSGNSQAFTPGAITIQGIAIQLSGRTSTPSGTLTVSLQVSGSGVNVSGTVVTINVEDLPNTGGAGSANLGWTYFKFASPITLIAATAYVVRMVASATGLVSVYRNATANNYSRALVTTTTGSPAVGDTLIITGDHTSAGSFSTTTVTMNNTTSTLFGNTYVGNRGTLNYGNSASTAYQLRIAGNLYVTFNGTYQIGTSGTPIPSTSSATLEISCSSLLQYSAFIYGTFTTYGNPIANFRAKLAADVSIGSTSSTSDISTGWLSGDTMVIPSTTTTSTQAEAVILSGNAVGTTIPHSAYTAAHGGNATTYVQADICNITRNVRIFSTSATNRSNIRFFNYSVSSIYYTAFYDLGSGSTDGTYAVNFTTNTVGSVDFQYNSVYQTSVLAYSGLLAIATNSVISNNIFYNLMSGTSNNSTILGTINDNNVVIKCAGFSTISGTVGSNNVISSNANHGLGGNFSYGASGNSIYSSGNFGWYSTGISSSLYSGSLSLNKNITNLKIWRNSNFGIVMLNGTSTFSRRDYIYDLSGLYMFGNGNCISPSAFLKMSFSNSYFWGGSTFVTSVGIDVLQTTGAPYFGDTAYFNNCYFGKLPDGTLSPFSTACIRGNINSTIIFSNCEFNGTEIVTSPGYQSTNSTMGFVSLNHNNINGSYKIFVRNGYLMSDTTIFYSSPLSLRMVPSSTSFPVNTPNISVPVKSGNTCTVSVKVRKSQLSDGAAYNGNQPKLMYVYNPLSGNLSETIGTSMTSAVGVWETLTYTTPAVSYDSILEFYVECGGTTGWINVDGWTTTTFNSTRGMEFCAPLGTYVEADYRKPGGSYTFIN